MRLPGQEEHRSGRVGWLRAAVLGADDGIASTASLMIGVAASSAPKGAILVSGVAGLVAGAMSMAVGEYVSVSSQRDAERADIERERRELAGQPQAELDELATIYVKRGLDKDLAMKVAEQLSVRDRLGAHMRDELGIDQAASLVRCRRHGYRPQALRPLPWFQSWLFLLRPRLSVSPRSQGYRWRVLRLSARLVVISAARRLAVHRFESPSAAPWRWQ